MKPKVFLHNSVSVDGRTTGFMPDMGTHYGILSTWKPDVHLAGSNTILAMPEEIPPETEDDLKEPEGGGEGNILVIPDSQGQVRCWHFLKRQPFWNRFVALVSESTPQEFTDYLEKRYVSYIKTGEDRVDFAKAFEVLNTEYDVKTILLDSGGTLNGVLLSQGLVDEVSILVHPVLVGGDDPLTIFKGQAEGLELKLIHFEKMEKDLVWLRYEVGK